jgi:Flp pilus assembly protein TadG
MCFASFRLRPSVQGLKKDQKMKTPSLLLKRFVWRGGNRGIAVVYIALLLVVLLAFVGLAIDIGYMYVAKTQLQNAADAASLAGAAVLTERSKSINQPTARESAWKIACNNKVVPADQKVFLISAAGTCTFPPSDLNNTTNNADGDIVLGRWDATTGFRPRIENGTEVPLPAGSYINAVKVVSRRTSEAPVANVKIGNNPVSLFFGKIFSLLPGGGPGWGTMSVTASAIAVRSSPTVLNMPLCLPNCGYVTTLSVVSPNLTPGVRFYTKGSTLPLIGWTSYLETPTSVPNIVKYLTGEAPPPDFCNLPNPICLNTTNGLDNPTLCILKGMLNEQSADYVVNGVTVHGLKVFVPIVDSASNPCPHSKEGCISDPTYQPGDAFPFITFAEIIITDSVPQGNCPSVTGPFASGDPGIVIVGTGSGGGAGLSSISCFDCTQSAGEFIVKTKLVK